jgi:hypothetical protein
MRFAVRSVVKWPVLLVAQVLITASRRCSSDTPLFSLLRSHTAACLPSIASACPCHLQTHTLPHGDRFSSPLTVDSSWLVSRGCSRSHAHPLAPLLHLTGLPHCSLLPPTRWRFVRHTSRRGSRRARARPLTVRGCNSGRAPPSDGLVSSTYAIPVRGAALRDVDLCYQVDGASYSFLGQPVVQGADFKLVVQKSATVRLTVDYKDGCMLTCPPSQFTSTRSEFVLSAGGIDITATFLSPVELRLSTASRELH